MPLLSRLFGRKHQDDDKTPSAEWPRGAQAVGAQPLGDRSLGTAPFVPYTPPADTAEVEPGSEPVLSEAREEDAAEDADAEPLPTEPESTGSEAEPLAAGAPLENEPAQALSRPDGEDGGGAFETQGMLLGAGEGLLDVLGADDNHDFSSNGSLAVDEMPADAFSMRATVPNDDMEPPFGEASNPFGALSKESADAFTASIDLVGTFPVETSDPFASPASTPSTPFNALAAASADAFEMPMEKITDPFGTPADELPKPATQADPASSATRFKSQTTRGNPFMKLVTEAQEVTEASDSPDQSKEEAPPLSVAGGKPPQDTVRLTSDAARLTTVAVPPAGTEAHTLIGGKEDDLVPLIPDTETDEADAVPVAEIDESGIAEAAVASLKSACDFLVGRVKKLSAQQDGTRVVAGLIALVGELDARYALDMGIRRRNGVEELLVDVRGRMAEGDRFILESLENGRGGLTADTFLHDLKTIAPSDRPRMLGHYVVFLTFMIKRVLHQYIRSLEEDRTRTYEISYHLDYLVEGVRDVLMKKVSAGAS